MTAAAKTLLVLGHPSHELRVYHWLLRERPAVMVLTDGSANRGFPVSAFTKEYLRKKGFQLGSLFGAFPDREFYSKMEEGDLPFFRSIAAHLAEVLQASAITTVTGDAVEGFNPTHDLCRMLINTAASVARWRRRTPLENYEFDLVGPILRPEDEGRDDLILLRLTEAERDEKIAFALEYPGVTEDVRRQLERYGPDSLSVECLRPADEKALFSPLFAEKPPYEKYGEERVAKGLYKKVLRYSEHIWPIQQDLARWVREETGTKGEL